MKEKLFKFLNICKKIFIYIYAIFPCICLFYLFMIELMEIKVLCYYIISNDSYNRILLFIITIIGIVYFNYYLYCVGKHIYNIIISNKNTTFIDYFMSFSIIPLFLVVCVVLFIVSFDGR